MLSKEKTVFVIGNQICAMLNLNSIKYLNVLNLQKRGKLE